MTRSPIPLILFLPQDKQNEASYLRDHKQELTEELAGTILQRVGRFRPGQGLWGAGGETHRMDPFADAMTRVKGP